MGGGGSKGVHAYVSGQVKKMAESPDDVVVDILEGLTKMVHRPRSYRTTRRDAVRELEAHKVIDQMLKVIEETFPEMQKEHVVVGAIALLKAVARDKDGAMMLAKKKAGVMVDQCAETFKNDEFIPNDLKKLRKIIRATNAQYIKGLVDQALEAGRNGETKGLVEILREHMEKEEVVTPALDVLYDLSEGEDSVNQVFAMKEYGVPSLMVAALTAHSNDAKLYSRGLSVLTSCITKDTRMIAAIGKTGGCKCAVRGLWAFPNDPDCARQTLWLLNELLSHERNIYTFCHERGPHYFRMLDEKRRKSLDPTSLFIPTRISQTMQGIKKYEKMAAADAVSKEKKLKRERAEELAAQHKGKVKPKRKTIADNAPSDAKAFMKFGSS